MCASEPWIPCNCADLERRESAQVVGLFGAEAWDNKNGPEGVSAPESPALDQRSYRTGSASRG